MTDQIFIKQLKVDAIIGIHDFEKQNTQPLLFDIDMAFDCRLAAQSDDINDALDYFAVSEQVTEWVNNSRCELIETLAEQLVAMILKKFPCQAVKLSVYKPRAVANAESVGLTIHRQRH